MSAPSFHWSGNVVDAYFNLERNADAPVPVTREAGREDEDGNEAAAAYRLLTGNLPQNATIDKDADFDRHVFACILALALTEKGGVVNCAGLGSNDLEALLTEQFSPQLVSGIDCRGSVEDSDHDEIEMVRDLLLANRSTSGESGRLLAAMVARRALEPNHLWEDLGLRDRGELTRLLERHFQPLAAKNTKNMRWKRYFYRVMCESDGFVMCSTPVCTNCADYNSCFGEESGESRLIARSEVPPPVRE
jgi:nitrogen fixation protein NifQ